MRKSLSFAAVNFFAVVLILRSRPYARRVVNVRFVSLSKPEQPHHNHRASTTERRCCTSLKPDSSLSAVMVELAGVEPASSNLLLSHLRSFNRYDHLKLSSENPWRFECV